MIKIQDFTYRDSDKIKKNVQILYQDENLIALSKPSGLQVIPDRWNKNLLNLKELLETQFRKHSQDPAQHVWTVHRIDADTSGLIIFARNPDNHKFLNGLFERNLIQKRYLAIVEGIPQQKKGIIDLPLAYPDAKTRGVRIDEGGKSSQTEYFVQEEFQNYSILEVMPRTGRMHQIRIHLKAINHPLLIDPLYNNRSEISLAEIKKTGKFSKQKKLISRLTLHAWKLRIPQSDGKSALELTAPLPKDFRGLLNALRKWDR